MILCPDHAFLGSETLCVANIFHVRGSYIKYENEVIG